ncbi:MAG: GNAT family N-acetyltransferase [Gammaproteobacteria bacterium]
MLIQPLTTANMQCLDRLAPEVFDNAIDQVQLGRFLGDPRHVMLVAIEDGLVVGMASGVEYFHPDMPPQMWINEVVVSPACQRRGIGRALTTALVEVASLRAGLPDQLQIRGPGCVTLRTGCSSRVRSRPSACRLAAR